VCATCDGNGKVVPADQLTGAVSTLREIHELVQTPDVDPEALLNTIHAATSAALRAVGGQ
jgi:hypothetical protein